MQTKAFPGAAQHLQRKLGAADGRSPEFQFACPFCLDRKGSESSDKKLRVNDVKGTACCFRCGYTAGLQRLFRDLNGGKLTEEEREILEGAAQAKRPQGENLRDFVIRYLYADEAAMAGVRLRPTPLPPGTIPLNPAKKNGARAAWKYLERRGVTDEMVERFDIRYCMAGRCGGYLIFPIKQGGEVVCYTTRLALRGEHKPKSLDPKKRVNNEGVQTHYDKSTCLLNYDGVIGRKQVTLVEGPMDTLAHASNLGMMGKRLSPAQRRLVIGLTEHGLEELVIGLDPDAIREAEELMRNLQGTVPKVSIMHFMAKSDPWDNRGRYDELLKTRRSEVSLAERVRARLVKAG